MIIITAPTSVQRPASSVKKLVLVSAAKIRLPSTRFTHSSSKGFTLIEMIVAIALMGIIAGFGIPGLYGVYQNQQMVNSAQEIRSAMQLARSRALANFQGDYTVPKELGGPLSDCEPGHPYVKSYSFELTNLDSLPGTYDSYKVTQQFKSANADGVTPCSAPNPTPAPIVSKKLPSSIKIVSVKKTAGTADMPVTYDTVSGKTNLSWGFIQLEFETSIYGRIQHKYVCITDVFFDLRDSCSDVPGAGAFVN